jgi:2-oxoglutarate dehydrogenase E1 component
MNGLVMLLPHGYEGQGAEHSSARMERFLQSAPTSNMVMVNCTTPANFFHAAAPPVGVEIPQAAGGVHAEEPVAPPACVSTMDELANGSFQEVIDDPKADPKSVKTLILCQGKIYYELLERKEETGADDVALVRIEQLHPLPEPQLEKIFARYSNAEEVRWVQEEPENMGAWPYMFKHLHKVKGAPSVEALRSVSRRASGAPATGRRRAQCPAATTDH